MAVVHAVSNGWLVGTVLDKYFLVFCCCLLEQLGGHSYPAPYRGQVHILLESIMYITFFKLSVKGWERSTATIVQI